MLSNRRAYRSSAKIEGFSSSSSAGIFSTGRGFVRLLSVSPVSPFVSVLSFFVIGDATPGYARFDSKMNVIVRSVDGVMGERERERGCIFVDLGRFPLTRREIPLEGWFFFSFGSVEVDGLMERICVWMKLILCEFFFSSVTRRLERRRMKF